MQLQKYENNIFMQIKIWIECSLEQVRKNTYPYFYMHLKNGPKNHYSNKFLFLITLIHISTVLNLFKWKVKEESDKKWNRTVQHNSIH